MRTWWVVAGALTGWVLGCTPNPPGSTTPSPTPTDPSASPSASVAGVSPPWQGAVPVCTGNPAEFPALWINGEDCTSESDIQVHRYDENTWILRQSMCTDFEGPFLFLMFGQDRVLLEDTGAGGIAIASTVYGIIDQWLTENGKSSVELVVLNSHAHGDHIAGNAQFSGQPDTTVVGTSVNAVSGFFGISWPTEIVSYDLGGRTIDVVPIPGHQTSHVALYDDATGWLLTGDTLYPGRLYISDFPTYRTSIQRLVDHMDARAARGYDVCWVLGTHIEMSNTPGDDFPLGSTFHPDEHPLQLDRSHVLELRDAVDAMSGNPQVETHDDFIVTPL